MIIFSSFLKTRSPLFRAPPRNTSLGVSPWVSQVLSLLFPSHFVASFSTPIIPTSSHMFLAICSPPIPPSYLLFPSLSIPLSLCSLSRSVCEMTPIQCQLTVVSIFLLSLFFFVVCLMCDEFVCFVLGRCVCVDPSLTCTHTCVCWISFTSFSPFFLNFYYFVQHPHMLLVSTPSLCLSLSPSLLSFRFVSFSASFSS